MTTPPPTHAPLPPPDPNNPRDLRNRPAYRRARERMRHERDREREREAQLTLTEPIPGDVHGTEEHDHDGDPDTDTTTTILAVTPIDGIYNDHRNALEFVQLHHEDVRYCWCRERWVEWNGTRWELDPGAGMQERARYFSEAILQQAAECRYPIEGKELLKRGRALGNRAGILAMLDLASSDPRVSLRDLSVWDADPFLLGVENGVVDLRTLRFHAPERDLMMTKQARVAYDPAATCPKWDAFVEQVLPDPEVRHFMQVSAGYWLTGDISAQCFWFCYGSGANGKSTFLNTLFRLSGDYAQKAGDMLSVNAKGSNVPLELSTLPGVRYLTGNEVTDGMKLHEALVKDITGGDVLKGREHYEAFFNFRPACKLIMYGNHRPTITGTDGGMWRRVRLVPFTTVVPDAQRNPHLEKELTHELPGILNWCLRGLAYWLENGNKLPMPKAVLEATQGYREDSDPLGEFLAETTEKVLDLEDKVLLNELFEQYGRWCNECGRRFTLSRQTLRMRMEERGYATKVITKGRVLLGLRLKSDSPFSD